MDWMSWKPWTALALILIAVFAIYTFAATDRGAGPLPERTVRTPQHTAAGGPRVAVSAPGVGLVHMEWLDMPSGTYKSNRNLFAYKVPPPPPPPAPKPPPDRDKDGVPDFQDNCPDVPNPSQVDEECLNALGTALMSADDQTRAGRYFADCVTAGFSP